MNIGSLSSIYSNFIQPILGIGSGTTSSTPVTSSTDSQQLSPFAQLATTLQQLQQQNPAQYQRVTSQLATNLQTAVQTAQSGGNTTLANQLTQLSTDFQNASQNGQLPDFQTIANGLSGGHHHHHSGNSSSTSTGSLLSQFTSSAGSAQSQSLNPAAIIFNTLSSAGISIT